MGTSNHTQRDKQMRHTSIEAMNSRTDESKQNLEDLVEAILYTGDKTDEEIFDIVALTTKYSPSGTRTARKKLETDGKVFDTGSTKKGSSGRKAIIWSLKDQTTLF